MALVLLSYGSSRVGGLSAAQARRALMAMLDLYRYQVGLQGTAAGMFNALAKWE